MVALKNILIILFSIIILSQAQAVEPRVRTDVQVEDKIAWGEVVEGVQVRLLADSKVWKFGQIPTFECDIRNNGPHKWKLPLSQQGYRLEVDGHMFTYPGKPEKWKLLKSEDELNNVAIQANPGWGRDMLPDYMLALRPGTHTIRLGVLPRPARRILPPKPALCMSNPITIEVIPLDGMDADIEPLGMTIFGRLKTLELSNWKRRGHNCAIDFESGRVMAMPASVRKTSESKRVKWMREQGIDAVANISDEEGYGLIGVDLAVQKFERDHRLKITVEEAQEVMRNVEVTTGKTPIPVPITSTYSHCYVIKTRDGNVFVLDILGGHNRRKNVKFFYKRIQQTVDSISVSRTTQIVGLGVRPPIDECSGISIETPNNWKLHINKDGSAVLYFGNSDRSPQFPVGSFKFVEVYSLIASGQLEYGTKYDRPYKIAFHIPNTRHDNPGIGWPHCFSSFEISVGRHKNIAQLFDKADALSERHWNAKEDIEGLRERNPIIQPVIDVQVEGKDR